MDYSFITTNADWLFWFCYSKTVYDGFLLAVVVQCKCLETFIVPNTTEYTITCLFPLFFKHGYPIPLVSDKASQFTSVEIKTLLGNHAVRHMLSLPYHPATDGHAERYVQILTHRLKGLTSESDTLQYRKMPHVTVEESPVSLRHIR